MDNNETVPNIKSLEIELYRAQIKVLKKYAPYLECPHCHKVGFTTARYSPELLRCLNPKCGALPRVSTVTFYNNHKE